MINCNRRDGSARAVNEVAERLADRGHEVHLYARTAEDLDLNKVHWHRIRGLHWPEVADFLTYYWITNWLLRHAPFDIIHSIGCNTQMANVVTIQNIQPAKRKILKQFGGEEKVFFLRRFTRYLYLQVTSAAEHRLYTKRPRKKPPVFMPVSRGVEAELRTHYDIDPAPVRIVPNAADTSIFHPLTASEKVNWRKANGFNESDIICIFTGGEWTRKGLDLAIRAIGKIAQPELKLFVAGDDSDRTRFREMAEQHAPGRIVFGGFRRDVATAMASSDLFLFPSHYEAFSLATIEAAACGLPIIGTRINGSEDFIQPGINGAFIEPNPEHISTVLISLLADRESLHRMGVQARELVEKEYTWDRVTTLTEDAYQLVSSAGTPSPKDPR